MAGGLKFELEVDDQGIAKIKKLEDSLEDVGKTGDKAGKKTRKALDKATAAAKRAGRAAGNVARKMQMIGLAAAAVAATGFGFLIKQGIAFNAKLESIETQFGVIYGSTKRAAVAMKELVAFSASTPFQLAEVAEGAKILEAFGLGGTRNLRNVGDAAAAAQRPLTEVAMVFGRIKSGAFGEAFMRLAEMGLATREMLEAEGLQFNNSGSYIGSVEDAIDAITRIVEGRFGGMMDKLSATWNGKWSTLKDNFAVFAGEFTKPLFEKLKPRMDQLIEIFNQWGKSKEFKYLGNKIAEMIDRAAGEMIKWMGDFPKVVQWILIIIESFDVVWESIKQGVQWFRDVWKAATEYASALLLDMAGAISVMSAGPMQEAGMRIAGFLFSAPHFSTAAAAALDEAINAPGFMQPLDDFIAKKRAELEAGASYDFIGPPSPDAGGTGLDAPGKDPAIQKMIDNLAALKEAKAELAKFGKEIFSEMWRDIAQTMQDGVADSFAMIITESGNVGRMINDMWKNIGRSVVREIMRAGVAWVVNLVKIQVKEKAINEASAALQLKQAVSMKSAYGTEAGSAASLAAAKYHSAYAALPFIGPGLASAAISAMLGQMAAAGGIATVSTAAGFRAGGLVPGGGSGIEDDRIAYVSGGEYILPKGDVDAIGTRALDSLRLGLTESESTSLEVNLYGGGDITEEEVEEALAPILERLNEQGRFKVSA